MQIACIDGVEALVEISRSGLWCDSNAACAPVANT